jgi:hypothetical protein
MAIDRMFRIGTGRTLGSLQELCTRVPPPQAVRSAAEAMAKIGSDRNNR